MRENPNSSKNPSRTAYAAQDAVQSANQYPAHIESATLQRPSLPRMHHNPQVRQDYEQRQQAPTFQNLPWQMLSQFRHPTTQMNTEQIPPAVEYNQQQMQHLRAQHFPAGTSRFVNNQPVSFHHSGAISQAGNQFGAEIQAQGHHFPRRPVSAQNRMEIQPPIHHAIYQQCPRTSPSNLGSQQPTVPYQQIMNQYHPNSMHGSVIISSPLQPFQQAPCHPPLQILKADLDIPTGQLPSVRANLMSVSCQPHQAMFTKNQLPGGYVESQVANMHFIAEPGIAVSVDNQHQQAVEQNPIINTQSYDPRLLKINQEPRRDISEHQSLQTSSKRQPHSTVHIPNNPLGPKDAIEAQAPANQMTPQICNALESEFQIHPSKFEEKCNADRKPKANKESHNGKSSKTKVLNAALNSTEMLGIDVDFLGGEHGPTSLSQYLGISTSSKDSSSFFSSTESQSSEMSKFGTLGKPKSDKELCQLKKSKNKSKAKRPRKLDSDSSNSFERTTSRGRKMKTITRKTKEFKRSSDHRRSRKAQSDSSDMSNDSSSYSKTLQGSKFALFTHEEHSILENHRSIFNEEFHSQVDFFSQELVSKLKSKVDRAEQPEIKILGVNCTIEEFGGDQFKKIIGDEYDKKIFESCESLHDVMRYKKCLELGHSTQYVDSIEEAESLIDQMNAPLTVKEKQKR
ncbi:hypothetical protein ACOME3_005042 [Neoechinorhynchus agilis]